VAVLHSNLFAKRLVCIAPRLHNDSFALRLVCIETRLLSDSTYSTRLDLLIDVTS